MTADERDDDVPTIPGKIVGWRAWEILGTGELEALALRHQWTPGVNTARCRIDDRTLWGYGGEGDEDDVPESHAAPDHDCECGLYAYHDHDMVSQSSDRYHVVGLIAAWGNVETHPHGFRAEHAEILALVVRPDAPAITRVVIEHVADRYGVPVMSPQQAEEHAAAVGGAVPANLRPEMPKPDESEGTTITSFTFATRPNSWGYIPTQPSGFPPPATSTNTAALNVTGTTRNWRVQNSLLWASDPTPDPEVTRIARILQAAKAGLRPRPITIHGTDLLHTRIRIRSGGVIDACRVTDSEIVGAPFHAGRVAGLLVATGAAAGAIAAAALS